MLDINCLMDTVPEALRYLEYSSEAVHVSDILSVISIITYFMASSNGTSLTGWLLESI